MSDEGSSDVSWLLLALLVGALIAVGDCRFSIPTHKPIKQKSEMLSQNEKRYFIVYNEDFLGYADFDATQRTVNFDIGNISRDPCWLDEAKLFLWTNDDVGYGLQMTDIAGSDLNGNALILNPNETISIAVATPSRTPALKDIMGFSIKSGSWPNRIIIRFGYERLGWWDRLRWFVADKIRKEK